MRPIASAAAYNVGLYFSAVAFYWRCAFMLLPMGFCLWMDQRDARKARPHPLDFNEPVRGRTQGRA